MIAPKIALSSLILASANAGRNKFARDAVPSQFGKQPVSFVDFVPEESADAGVDMAAGNLRGFDGVDANVSTGIGSNVADGIAPATKTELRLVGASTRVSRLPV